MALAIDTSSHARSTDGQRKRGKISRRIFARWGLVAALGVAASTWMVMTFAAMQGVAMSHGPGREVRFEIASGARPIVRPVEQDRNIQLAKFARLKVLPASQILTADAVLASRKRMIVKSAMVAAARLKERATAVELAFAKREQMHTPSSSAQPASGTQFASVVASGAAPGALVTAYGETGANPQAPSSKLFSLVLADPIASPDGALPDTIPLPVTRPAALAELDRTSPAQPVMEVAKPDKRQKTRKDPEVAYAPVEKPSFFGGLFKPANPARERTAVYDISAGIVYMPNGEKLEAHSGIGEMRDNPKYAHVPMRGPTPPGTYHVTMRESLFHGVEAVRLTPTDGVAPLGRVGLLAHSYLLKKRGDSHGCVAFADYPRFLKAFKNGHVTKMVIVSSMSDSSSARRLASLSRKGA